MVLRGPLGSDGPVLGALWSELYQLHAQHDPRVFRDPSSDDAAAAVRDLLASAGTLVAEVDGRPVGYLHGLFKTIEAVPGVRARTLAVMVDLVVAAPARGQGVGRALVRAWEARALEAGASSLEVPVWAFNTPAREFYHRLGYRPSFERLFRDLS